MAATFAALDGVAPNNIRSPTTEATEVTAMLAKKKQKLLDKVDGGRATHKVVGSATVAAVAINSAPKLSDFDSVAEHAEEMRKWIAKNLPKKAIEKDTRVRTRVEKTLACDMRHVRTTLARYYELTGHGAARAAYLSQDKYWACVGLFDRSKETNSKL